MRLQVANCAQSQVLKDAWAQGKHVYIHGWIYELEHGTLKDLNVSVGPPQ